MHRKHALPPLACVWVRFPSGFGNEAVVILGVSASAIVLAFPWPFDGLSAVSGLQLPYVKRNEPANHRA